MSNATDSSSAVAAAGGLALFLAGRTALQYWLAGRRASHLRPVGTVSRLIIYPVKSCLGISVASGCVEEAGLVCQGVLDRSFAVMSTDSGKLVSVKACPRLSRVQPVLDAAAPAGIRLSAASTDEQPAVSVMPDEAVRFSMFGQTVYGQACDAASNAWLRRVCEREDLQLVRSPRPDRSTMDELLECQRLGIASSAFAAADTPSSGDSRIAFANTAPLMLATEPALEGINRRLADKARPGVDWRNFRPNIVLSGPELRDRDEESWSFLFVGNCALAVLTPCTRCGITTVDSDAAALRSDGEPLRTLSEYRKDGAFRKFSPVFGVNCFVERPGEIGVGCEVLA